MKNNKDKTEGVRQHSPITLKDTNMINKVGYDGSVSYEELNQIRDVVYDRLDEWLGGGSSLEGNGVNFNFTFNGKPFLLRVEKDDFHTNIWMNSEMGFWSDDYKEYEYGLEVN